MSRSWLPPMASSSTAGCWRAARARATTQLIVMVRGDEPYSRDLQRAIDRLR